MTTTVSPVCRWAALFGAVAVFLAAMLPLLGRLIG
jgi:hypothetical protein